VTEMKRTAMAAITASLLATASLQAACTVSATDLNFGTYDTSAAGATDGTGNINVHCTFLIAIALHYTVKLSTGGSGTYTPREMQRDATYSLAYNLYVDSTRLTIWGDGSGSTDFDKFSSLLGLLVHDRNYPVYGRIPAQQNVPPGSYSDTITVTVEY
jgi:spore coat protein U-like protein